MTSYPVLPINRRMMLASGALLMSSSETKLFAASVASTIQDAARRRVNVLDYGAKGDGKTDDTQAFNRATQAHASWSADLIFTIDVPPGHYRVDGSVYVRKGQAVVGAGYSTIIDARQASGRTFILGSRMAAAGGAPDPGGAPVSLTQISTLGGSGLSAVIFTDAPGFMITDLFIVAPGIGIEVAGADGIISRIIFDQGLNGIVLHNCQNLMMSDIEFYLVNYGMTVGTDCADITLLNSLFCYCGYSAVLFADSSSDIANFKISSTSFIYNAVTPNFNSIIHCRSTNVDANFADCSFRNWTNFAIDHTHGCNVALTFNGCIFDGQHSRRQYNQSSKARLIATSADGIYRFDDCQFRNIDAGLGRIGAGSSRLSFAGGCVLGGSSSRFDFAPNASASISVKNVEGFLPKRLVNGVACAVLPWWGEDTFWRVVLRGAHVHETGSSVAFASEYIVAISRDPRGIATLSATPAWSAPNLATKAPKPRLCFGEEPGGPVGSSDPSGSICLSLGDQAAPISRFDGNAATIP